MTWMASQGALVHMVKNSENFTRDLNEVMTWAAGVNSSSIKSWSSDYVMSSMMVKHNGCYGVGESPGG